MFPHGAYLAGRVAARQVSNVIGCDSKALIAWTWVHAIIKWCTCAICKLSDHSTVATWKHQVHSIVITTRIVIWEHKTAYLTPRGGSRAPDLHRDSHRSDSWRWKRLMIKAWQDRAIVTVPSLEEHRTATTSRGRTPRSRSDRTAIAARSSRDRDSFRAESSPQSSEGYPGR